MGQKGILCDTSKPPMQPGPEEPEEEVMRGRREGETGNRDFSVPGMGFVLFWLTVFLFLFFLVLHFFAYLALFSFVGWGCRRDGGRYGGTGR